MTQAPIDKLIQDGLRRDISEAPPASNRMISDWRHYTDVVLPVAKITDTQENYMAGWVDGFSCGHSESRYQNSLLNNRMANALKVAVEALERYACPDIQNQHNYKAFMGVDDTKVARQALAEINRIAKGE